jgi:hypothetical protein
MASLFTGIAPAFSFHSILECFVHWNCGACARNFHEPGVYSGALRNNLIIARQENLMVVQHNNLIRAQRKNRISVRQDNG